MEFKPIGFFYVSSNGVETMRYSIIVPWSISFSYCYIIHNYTMILLPVNMITPSLRTIYSIVRHSIPARYVPVANHFFAVAYPCHTHWIVPIFTNARPAIHIKSYPWLSMRAISWYYMPSIVPVVHGHCIPVYPTPFKYHPRPQATALLYNILYHYTIITMHQSEDHTVLYT